MVTFKYSQSPVNDHAHVAVLAIGDPAAVMADKRRGKSEDVAVGHGPGNQVLLHYIK